MRLTDFDVLTFDMIGTLIDFERGILDFMNPRILRVRPLATETEILECYARSQHVVRTKEPDLLFSQRLPKIWTLTAGEFGVAVTEDDAAGFVRSARQWPAFA